MNENKETLPKFIEIKYIFIIAKFLKGGSL